MSRNACIHAENEGFYYFSGCARLDYTRLDCTELDGARIGGAAIFKPIIHLHANSYNLLKNIC